MHTGHLKQKFDFEKTGKAYDFNLGLNSSSLVLPMYLWKHHSLAKFYAFAPIKWIRTWIVRGMEIFWLFYEKE